MVRTQFDNEMEEFRESLDATMEKAAKVMASIVGHCNGAEHYNAASGNLFLSRIEEQIVKLRAIRNEVNR